MTRMGNGSPSVPATDSVLDAELVRELTMHACEGNTAHAIAALTGAIILVANDCLDTAAIIGCAIDGLTKGRAIASAARERALKAAKS